MYQLAHTLATTVTAPQNCEPKQTLPSLSWELSHCQALPQQRAVPSTFPHFITLDSRILTWNQVQPLQARWWPNREIQGWLWFCWSTPLLDFIFLQRILKVPKAMLKACRWHYWKVVHPLGGNGSLSACSSKPSWSSPHFFASWPPESK